MREFPEAVNTELNRRYLQCRDNRRRKYQDFALRDAFRNRSAFSQYVCRKIKKTTVSGDVPDTVIIFCQALKEKEHIFS